MDLNLAMKKQLHRVSHPVALSIGIWYLCFMAIHLTDDTLCILSLCSLSFLQELRGKQKGFGKPDNSLL